MIPFPRPNISYLYTLSQSKLLKDHTLHSGTCTYLYSQYMAVTPPGQKKPLQGSNKVDPYEINEL